MKKLSRDQKGFSLLELLVALSILAVGLLAAASMQGVALNSNAMANRISVGATLAQEAIEDINSWSRKDLRLRTGDAGTYTVNRYVPGSGTYTITYTITPNVPIADVSRIDVVVLRTDAAAAGEGSLQYITTKGERRYVTMTTYRRVFQ